MQSFMVNFNSDQFAVEEVNVKLNEGRMSQTAVGLKELFFWIHVVSFPFIFFDFCITAKDFSHCPRAVWYLFIFRIQYE